MGEYAALIRILACIGAALALFIGGFHYGSVNTELKARKGDDKARAELSELLESERARSVGLSDEIRAILDRPKAGVTIREIVKENPSNCMRPAAVTDSLQSEITRANQAIAASRGGAAVRPDPQDRKD